MMRILGFVLVVCSGGLLGWYKLSCYKRRAYALGQMCELVRFVGWQLKYTALPLPELARKIEKRREFAGLHMGGMFLDLVEKLTFEKAWNESVKRSVKINRFTQEDVTIVCKFGSGLGKTDMEGQSIHAQMSADLLETQRQEAITAVREKGKTAAVVWFSASAVLAFLLL